MSLRHRIGAGRTAGQKGERGSRKPEDIRSRRRVSPGEDLGCREALGSLRRICRQSLTAGDAKIHENEALPINLDDVCRLHVLMDNWRTVSVKVVQCAG